MSIIFPFCGDCGVREGEFHKPGCDMEQCPRCKRQRISCNCGAYLEGEEREPFFSDGFWCARCGKQMPTLVMVSDENWKEICGSTYPLDCVLCEKCMDFIAEKRGMGKLKKGNNLWRKNNG